MIFGTQDYARLLKDIIESEKRHPLYKETCDHAEAMSVHIYGEKPMYLLERVRPREDSDVMHYRIENYEPTTKSGADKALDIVSKVFNPTLFSIRWKDQSREIDELKSYTLEYFPNYNSIVNYNKDVALPKMIADPNGLMAVKVASIPEDQTETPEPEVVIYGSKNVWYYDRDHYLIFHHEEERDNRKFYYFEYYDKNQYLHFSAFYDASQRIVETKIEEQFRHGFNEIPAWMLRGKSKSLDNGSIVYESFFSSALPHWNLAVVHESDLLGAYINHMHPIRYELAEECNYQFPFEGMTYKCRGGTIHYPGHDDKGVDMNCPTCSGTGYRAVKSPYGAYQFNRQKVTEDGPAPFLPVGFITVPVEATKLLEDRTREMNKKAMWAINMDVEDEVGEVQSGVAKTIDRSGQHDTIFNIGQVMHDVHLTNQYYFINKYKFGQLAASANKDVDKNLPEINKPTKFDILTTAELINNFKVANESKVDKNYLRLKQIEIVASDISTNPDLKNYQMALLELDPLYGFAQAEISLGVAQGVIRKIDWALHENLKSFVDKAIEADKEFLNKPKPEKLAVIEGFANELIAGEKPRIEEDLLIKDEAFA
jgi:hypothetical protein